MIIAVTKTAHLNLIDTFDTLDTNKTINRGEPWGSGGNRGKKKHEIAKLRDQHIFSKLLDYGFAKKL